jgi:hypothetical protein
MKPLKNLGLAAVVATALIAFAGTGTASATVLCGNSTGTTKCTEAYAEGTEIKAVNEGTTTLTTSFKNIECSESTVGGKVTNPGGKSTAVSGSVETLTFGGCNCTVTVLKKGTLSVTQISGTDNGTLKSSGAEVTASCSTIFGTVHCIYATNETDLGTLTGGNPAKMDISSANIPRLTTSALCDESANWDATYKVTGPTPLYVGNTEEEVNGVEAQAAPITQTVGGKVKIILENKRKAAITIGTDGVTDATVLKMIGKSCAGALAAGAKCETRELECLKPGIATWGVVITPGNVLMVETIECDK